MNKMRKILFLLMTLAPLGSLSQIWDLDRCIDSALSNNVRVKKLEIEMKISKLNKDNIKYGYLPSINAGANNGLNWGQTIDQFTNEFATKRVQYSSFYLSGGLTLFSGLQNYYDRRVVEIDFESQVYNEQIEKRNIKISIAVAYLQCLLNNEILLIAKESLVLTKKNHLRMLEFINSGREAEFKSLEFESEEKNNEYLILKAKNDLNYSYLLLQQMMNVQYDSNFTVLPLLDTSAADQAGVGKGILSYPELKLSALEIRKQELEIKKSQAKLYPKLSASVSLGSGFSGNNTYVNSNGEILPKPFDTQLNENFYQSASLSLSIPIFNNNLNAKQIQIDKLILDQEKLNSNEQKNELIKKMEQLRLEIMNSKALYESLVKLVTVEEKKFEVQTLSYQKGVESFEKLLIAKNRLFNSKSQCLQAKYQYMVNQLIEKYYFSSKLQ